MSLEVLEKIQDTAVEAAGCDGKVSIVDATALGAGKCLIVTADGKYTVHQKTGVREHSLGDIASLCQWAAYAVAHLGASPVVWVSPEVIRVVTNDADDSIPRPVVYGSLRKTKEYELLTALASGEPRLFEQKGFVQLLRLELWDCLDPQKRDELVRILRSLASVSNTNGRAEVGMGKESLGREIDNEVTSNVGKLPETLTLQVRLFQDSSLEARQPVVCDLDVTPTTFKFSIRPMQSDLNEALENEMNDVVKLLRSLLPKDTPVFRGVYAK